MLKSSCGTLAGGAKRLESDPPAPAHRNHHDAGGGARQEGSCSKAHQRRPSRCGCHSGEGLQRPWMSTRYALPRAPSLPLTGTASFVPPLSTAGVAAPKGMANCRVKKTAGPSGGCRGDQDSEQRAHACGNETVRRAARRSGARAGVLQNAHPGAQVARGASSGEHSAGSRKEDRGAAQLPEGVVGSDAHPGSGAVPARGTEAAARAAAQR
eukprot:1572527-Prymnesium_polylepis.1